VLLAAAQQSGRKEITGTTFQLTRTTVQLRDWSASLPPGASVRFDTWPPRQLWASFMLADRPVCSLRPLLGTAYPHVPYSRKADYILTDRDSLDRENGRPADATGPPLRENRDYVLYRAKRSLPGPDLCSRRQVETPGFR
jgi:hypothetical protein